MAHLKTQPISPKLADQIIDVMRKTLGDNQSILLAARLRDASGDDAYNTLSCLVHGRLTTALFKESKSKKDL